MRQILDAVQRNVRDKRQHRPANQLAGCAARIQATAARTKRPARIGDLATHVSILPRWLNGKRTCQCAKRNATVFQVGTQVRYGRKIRILLTTKHRLQRIALLAWRDI